MVVHVKINQLVETGTPISDKTYVPLHPGQSAMSIAVVTSKSRKPRFVTDANNRTIGRIIKNSAISLLKLIPIIWQQLV
jgi:hypothetical protein